MKALATQLETLVRSFRRIQRERMQGLPFLNPALEVRAVGFVALGEGNEGGEGAVGVLLTPWFMNLILLPGEADWSGLPVGSKQTHGFASGSYDFTVAMEPDVGRYQMCSLFSPMAEFVDQAAAVATAQEVMRGLMDCDNREELTLHDEAVRRAWQGEPEKQEADDGPTRDDRMTLSERMVQPLSRRELLRGHLDRDRGDRDRP